MIWYDGRVCRRSEVRVDLDDRVFEHGLGLFETFRSYNGQATLLDRHLARLKSSANALKLPLDDVVFPNLDDVAGLLAANHVGGNALLRLTMTGGTDSGTKPSLWLTARPLPPLEPTPRVLMVYGLTISWWDTLASHKTLNYWSRRLAHEWAKSQGAIDCLLRGSNGWLWEGARNNVLFVPPGEPRKLVTPVLVGPIVPGIMRQTALEFAREHSFQVEERLVMLEELYRAEAIFLSNSVRGVRKIDVFEDCTMNRHTPSELTQLLTEKLPQFLAQKVS